MRIYRISVTILVLSIFLAIPVTGCQSEGENIYHPNQISASLMVKYMQQLKEQAKPDDKIKEQKRYLMVYDLYIKARSYAVFNKIFMGLTIFFAFIVLIWPSLGIFFGDRVKNAEWFRSAIVQTTITGIAALTFSFYSQYKDKQTYTENLIRYIVYSNEDIEHLSRKVVEEIGKIDRGFSFSSVSEGDNGLKQHKP